MFDEVIELNFSNQAELSQLASSLAQLITTFRTFRLVNPRLLTIASPGLEV